jgi:hypothetical protein
MDLDDSNGRSRLFGQEWQPNADNRGPMVHELKVWPAQFNALDTGVKGHEVRRFDRDYRVGDRLLLREFDPDRQAFTGRTLTRVVTHMTNPGTFGLPADIGVMTVVRPTPVDPLKRSGAWPFPGSL